MASWVLGEFQDDGALCGAARRLRELGHGRLDAHTPVPVPAVEEALGLGRSPVPLIALCGAILGGAGGYLMQWWMNAVDYSINVGGRPDHAAPAFIPVTFETTVLATAIFIVLGFFALAGFPRTHHPVFEVEAFRTASVDGLWLSAEVEPAAAEGVAEELRRLGARNVSRVEEEA
ncbi:MAG TPA: DUF3341 domain-containing protein [Anaeromyxobacteraceae bacterium]|jgi:hypothetical protein